ncbi:MAG: L-lactate dehydrogenase [Erysipelotrichia bacterium]|nr:L-lactate dehydrogenase [Erysipelotrichia bacterium]NCC55060.1 L-lactate dehydrogenase [Erysipelotrichia bacterium]
MVNIKEGKVVIIGAGMVGSSVLSAILSENVVSEIAMIDMNQDKVKGEVLDASHTTAFAYSSNVNIHVGSYEDCADAQVIIMTAGPSITKENASSRMLLLHKNIAVMDSVMSEIVKYTKEAIIIIVSNPLDILVYYAQSKFNYPKHKLMGTGTLLDTARLRQMIGKQCGVDSKNVHGYVLGEHGESAFITWSKINVSGIPFDQLETVFDTTLDKEQLYYGMRNVGLDMVRLKGYTSAGIAAACARLLKCIILNERSVLPIASVIDKEYGLHDVAMSLPSIVSKEGIERILEIPLSADEMHYLQECEQHIKAIIQSIEA